MIFKVFYRRNRKLCSDKVWALNAEEAQRKLLAFAKKLKWKIELVRREEC
jgi:hypothetical protein